MPPACLEEMLGFPGLDMLLLRGLEQQAGPRDPAAGRVAKAAAAILCYLVSIGITDVPFSGASGVGRASGNDLWLTLLTGPTLQRRWSAWLPRCVLGSPAAAAGCCS